MNINTTIRLNNGVEMPILGLGTWKSSSKEVGQAIKWSFEAGYKHIDTAAAYDNEEAVGDAIKEANMRKTVFLTTKLWNQNHNNPEKALNNSLRKLQTFYIDLYLMHWPVPKVRVKTWQVMERLYREGKCKAIGVSNFTVDHLKELLKTAEITPAVNQVEFSPYLYQKELLEYCNDNGIALEAYSPLTTTKKLHDKKLVEMATKYDRTSAQILIRWALQHNVICIPKSVNQDRISENAMVFDFEISNEDMKKLDSFNEDFRTCWDPTKVS